jgi:hypothetical protein
VRRHSCCNDGYVGTDRRDRASLRAPGVVQPAPGKLQPCTLLTTLKVNTFD